MLERRLHLDGTLDRAPRCFFDGDWCAKQADDLVADVFVERAVVRLNRIVHHLAEVFVEHGDDLGRFVPFGHRGKAADIRKQHRDFTQLAAFFEVELAGHELLDELRGRSRWNCARVLASSSIFLVRRAF